MLFCIALEQGDCAKLNLPIEWISQSAWRSSEWMHTDAFKTCHSNMRFRFENFVKTGKLNATDFIDFGDYQTLG